MLPYERTASPPQRRRCGGFGPVPWQDWDVRVALFTHDISLDHDTGRGHPERPARIGAVLDGIRRSNAEIVDVESPVANRATLELIHDKRYIDSIERFCRSGGGALDPDTVARPASWEAALRSAGAGPAAVDALLRGGADVGYIVMRPPGHHALPARAMGFCLFNNIAITARHLTERGDRVAIVDWDVHHGNGTQDIFYRDPEVLYVSMHEYPAYPGSGWHSEWGDGPGSGATVNVPWPTGTSGIAYRWAFERLVVPVLQRFEPDWILVSSGYDAHDSDPLAGIRLVETDYRYMASRIAHVAPTGRTILFLEGGYDLAALSGSARATIEGLAEPSDAVDAMAPRHGAARVIIDDLEAAASRQWDL